MSVVVSVVLSVVCCVCCVRCRCCVCCVCCLCCVCCVCRACCVCCMNVLRGLCVCVVLFVWCVCVCVSCVCVVCCVCVCCVRSLCICVSNSISKSLFIRCRGSEGNHTARANEALYDIARKTYLRRVTHRSLSGSLGIQLHSCQSYTCQFCAVFA